MKLRNLAIVCLLGMLAASSALAANYTPRFNIMIPTGYTSYVSSTATSGTLNGLGCSATWTVGANAAEVHFTGTVGSAVWAYNPPYWDVWFTPGGELGMNVEVTSTTANAYSIQASYNSGTWNFPQPTAPFTGNHSFAFALPTNSRCDFELMSLNINQAYDITMRYTWGSLAVPAETSSWGEVKALFR